MNKYIVREESRTWLKCSGHPHTHLHETWNDTLQNNGVLCIVKCFCSDQHKICWWHIGKLQFFRSRICAFLFIGRIIMIKKCILGMTKMDKEHKIFHKIILWRNEYKYYLLGSVIHCASLISVLIHVTYIFRPLKIIRHYTWINIYVLWLTFKHLFCVGHIVVHE